MYATTERRDEVETKMRNEDQSMIFQVFVERAGQRGSQA
jgi:hypothetical protein